MRKKIELFDRYLMSRNDRLEAGAVLTVKLEDGMITIYKEWNPKTAEKKTVTLVEKFDDQLDLAVSDLIYHLQ